jgi:hypothetical protein
MPADATIHGASGTKFAGGIADLRLRKAGKRLEELLLRQVEADKPGARQSKIGIDADPRDGMIFVGDLDAGAQTRRARNGRAGVAVEEQLRILVQVEEADRAVEIRYRLGTYTNLGSP